MSKLLRWVIFLALTAQLLGTGWLPAAGVGAAAVTLYGDALATGWEDWSWNPLNYSFNNAGPLHAGSASIRVQFSGGWGGLQIGTNAAPPATSANNTLEFWINGGSAGGQAVRVTASSECSSVTQDLSLTANTWSKVSLSLDGPGGISALKSVSWANPTGSAQPVFYIDDIRLTSAAPSVTQPSAGPALAVNAAAGRKAISPLIYGMSFPDETLAAELRLPLQRWGGNSTTRYNWQNDTSNRASDWYFENIPNENLHPELLPNGSASDQFVAQARRTQTQVLLTVPLIGWTPKSRAVTCAFNTAKYGAQQAVDPYNPTCGNGLTPSGAPITGNAPSDTSSAITPDFVTQWIGHLTGQFGSANNGGVRFYNLDNEPMLWNSTHRDVHPQPTSYDELRDRTLAYAPAIKAADPGAQTLGPVLWGWTAYFYSALDAAPGGAWWNNPLDRKAHGGLPLVEWYLQQMRSYQQQHGQRILDYFDLHYYPQANGVFSTQAGDAAAQKLRLRSTRALWDAQYVDESWIGEPVNLLPRMQAWVDNNYAGTKLAVSEYSWGAMCHISGALAQADVLGIFGREGLDLAALWGPPAANEPGAYAFRMFRNYDGAGSAFGTLSVQAASADPDQLAVYAAQRPADGALTVMVINKSTASLSSNLALGGFGAGTKARAYQYSTSDPNAIAALPNPAVGASGIQAVYPGYSITLYVVENLSEVHSAFLPKINR